MIVGTERDRAALGAWISKGLSLHQVVERPNTFHEKVGAVHLGCALFIGLTGFAGGAEAAARKLQGYNADPRSYAELMGLEPMFARQVSQTHSQCLMTAEEIAAHLQGQQLPAEQVEQVA